MTMDGQMSIFSFIQNESQEYNPIEDYANGGSGFTNGKKRIAEFFHSNTDKKERIDFLKKEYGVGGFGSPTKKPNYIHGADHSQNGHKIEYYNENMENIKLSISYEELECVIDRMIIDGRYESEV
jgi:Uri superfamily endonuclease